MIKTIIHVPHSDNDGQVFSLESWRELERQVVDRFGGYSCDDQVQGAWRSSEGVVFWDVSRRYTIAVGSWTAIPAFLDFVSWVRVTFRQEAIYVEIAGVPEVLGPTTEENPPGRL